MNLTESLLTRFASLTNVFPGNIESGIIIEEEELYATLYARAALIEKLSHVISVQTNICIRRRNYARRVSGSDRIETHKTHVHLYVYMYIRVYMPTFREISHVTKEARGAEGGGGGEGREIV